MSVDQRVDAYPHRVFKGRVAGFSPGTGLAGAPLLPPANATTLADRRVQFHESRLVERVRPAHPLVDHTRQRLSQVRVVRGGVTTVVGDDQAFSLLANMVRTQARVMSYRDVFWVFWIITALAFPLVFLMKKSVAHAGAATH